MSPEDCADQVDGVGWMPDCDCAEPESAARCCSACCDGNCFTSAFKFHEE